MKEVSPLCPPNCNFKNFQPMCGECFHQDDIIFDKPRPVMLGDKKVKVIGTNGDRLYLKGGISISVFNPHLRKMRRFRKKR